MIEKEYRKNVWDIYEPVLLLLFGREEEDPRPSGASLSMHILLYRFGIFAVKGSVKIMRKVVAKRNIRCYICLKVNICCRDGG